MSDYRIGRLNGRFTVSWWEGGKRKRYRLKARTRKEAESEAIDVVRRKLQAPTGATVKDLWEAYRKEKEGRQVAHGMMHEGKAVLPHFGHLRPDQVTVDLCRAYSALRHSQGKSDGTTWTELGHLRTVMRWAEACGLISRAARIERPQKPAPKDRWLNDEEIERLLGIPTAHHIKLAIILMLSTAGRVGAILELRWDRVDLHRGQIDLRASDIGPRKGRAVVPMNAMARAALQSAREAAQTEYVIEWAGQPVKSIKTGFYAAVEKAGLRGVSPHVLRHTSAVHMVQAGIRMDEIAQFLGHSNTSVTFRTYARFSPTHLLAAANVLDFTSIKAVK